MASSDGLGSLSILNEDSLRLILRDQTLKDNLHGLASSSKQLLRQVLRSSMRLMLDLGGVRLAAKWGEWLRQASGLHLQLDAINDFDAAAEVSAILVLLLSEPNPGVSALTANLNVSDAHGRMATAALLPFDTCVSFQSQLCWVVTRKKNARGRQIALIPVYFPDHPLGHSSAVTRPHPRASSGASAPSHEGRSLPFWAIRGKSSRSLPQPSYGPEAPGHEDMLLRRR